MANHSDTNGTRVHGRGPRPNPALGALDRLVGTWDVSGPNARGRVTFEWMEGGFYFVQHVEIDHGSNRIKGTEYVGYDESNAVLKSYVFSNQGPGPFGGVALEYAWEVGDDGLTIWGGFVGSPARYRGEFGDDGNTVTGAWEWPGGGYESNMTRVG